MRVATPGGEYIHIPELTNGEYTRESNKNMINSKDIRKHLKSFINAFVFSEENLCDIIKRN